MRHIRTLESTFAEVAHLEDRMALSTWHRVVIGDTAPLAEASSAEPGEEISHLLGHESTRIAMEACLNRLESLEPDRVRDVIFWYSRWWRIARLPAGLVKDLSEQCDKCKAMWGRSDARNNSQDILRALRKIVSLTREKADIWRATGTRYDALLDVYDPGQSAASLMEQYGWLDDLEGGTTAPLHGPQEYAPLAGTLSLAREVAELCGFDTFRGRIALGKHPMTLTVGSNDVRILIDPRTGQAFLQKLLHEVGHAVLEQDLKTSARWSWRAQAPSQAFHESIAKLFESLGTFLLHRYNSEKPVGTSFGGRLDRSSESLNGGRKSIIRLESTGDWYSWHIWLRFKLERMLIEGELEASDLPEAWDQEISRKFENPASEPRASWLQDIQWFMGLFGYFPVYWGATARGGSLRETFERELGHCDNRSLMLSTLQHGLRRSFVAEWDRVAQIYLGRLSAT